MHDEVPITTTRGVRETAGSAGGLERAVRAGALARLRRGAYAETEDLAGLGDAARHRLLVRAARLAACSGEPVFSHESAAALHGIPIIGNWPEAVVVTSAHGGRRGLVERLRRPLAAHEAVVTPDGTRCTSLTRTAVDLATRRTLLGGIAAMSHARFRGASTVDLGETLARLGPVTGIGRARLALARSTAGSESVLETLVMVRCQDYGFEPPEQQYERIGSDGRRYRVDFARDGGRILLKADGRAKYADPSIRGERTAEEVLWAQKRREDALQAGCDRFLRATWLDAWHWHELARRLEAAGIPRTRRPSSSLTF